VPPAIVCDNAQNDGQITPTIDFDSSYATAACRDRGARLTLWRIKMGLGTIILVLLVLVLLGVIPAWPHSRGWGYGPSGGVGLLVVILLVLLLTGRI
jgi:hypothetical protein